MRISIIHIAYRLRLIIIAVASEMSACSHIMAQSLLPRVRIDPINNTVYYRH